MNKRESKKDPTELSNQDLLNYVINKNPKFIGKEEQDREKYLRPVSRYDSWLLISALSNLVLIDKMNELIKLIKEKK